MNGADVYWYRCVLLVESTRLRSIYARAVTSHVRSIAGPPLLPLRRPTPESEMTHRDVGVVEVKTARPVTKSATADSHRSLRDICSFSRAVAGEPLDLMFFPAVYSWFPVRRHLPMVVTLHDAIAEHLPGLIFASWKGRLLWSLKMRLACWRAAGNHHGLECGKKRNCGLHRTRHRPHRCDL